MLLSPSIINSFVIYFVICLMLLHCKILHIYFIFTFVIYFYINRALFVFCCSSALYELDYRWCATRFTSLVFMSVLLNVLWNKMPIVCFIWFFFFRCFVSICIRINQMYVQCESWNRAQPATLNKIYLK